MTHRAGTCLREEERMRPLVAATVPAGWPEAIDLRQVDAAVLPNRTGMSGLWLTAS